MSKDQAVFVLEKLKLKAKYELEQRIEKHLRDEFYHKILPKIQKEISTKLMVDVVNDCNFLEIKLTIKEEI